MTNVESLRASIRLVQSRHAFEIPAMVVLPDHVHALWVLPPGDADYATRWGLIKAGFSRALPKTERISPSRQGKGERGIWQRRYWEHLIRDDEDYAQHVDYIHSNPVKHGYVNHAADWPHSSIHRYIKAGTLPADWAVAAEAKGAFGE